MGFSLSLSPVQINIKSIVFGGHHFIAFAMHVECISYRPLTLFHDTTRTDDDEGEELDKKNVVRRGGGVKVDKKRI